MRPHQSTSTIVCDFINDCKERQREKLDQLLKQSHRSLSIKHCSILTAQDFLTLSQRSPNIVELTLENCAMTTKDVFQQGMNHLCQAKSIAYKSNTI